MTPALLDAHLAERQVQLVMNDDHLVNIDLVEAAQRGCRLSREIHEALWLCRHHDL
jgi:hypothetical protein